MTASALGAAERIEEDLQAVRRLVLRLYQRQGAAGLTPPQLLTLATLFRQDGVGLPTLSEQLGLAHATVSGIVDRLAERGRSKDGRRRSSVQPRLPIGTQARLAGAFAQVDRGETMQ